MSRTNKTWLYVLMLTGGLLLAGGVAKAASASKQLQKGIEAYEQRKDRITLGTILKLEQYFRCSRATLLYRLKELGWISEDLISSFIENVKRSAAEYGYNTNLYEPTEITEVCGDYNIKARGLFDKGLISRSKYVSLIDDMGLNKEG